MKLYILVNRFKGRGERTICVLETPSRGQIGTLEQTRYQKVDLERLHGHSGWKYTIYKLTRCKE